MAEKKEEVVITGKDIAKYLESTDAGTAADKLQELIDNIHTLVERIQDLIEEDQLLSAAGAVSFSAALTAAGEPQFVAMIGTNKNIILGLNALADNLKEIYMNKKEIEQ